VKLPLVSEEPITEVKMDKELIEGFGRKAVLVVDDILLHQKVLVLLLNKLGFTNIRVANDGVEAVKAANETQFDYIFMDMFMPRLDGISAAKIIQKMPKFSTVPMIGVTASTLTDEQVAEARAIFSMILMKPVNIEHLVWVLDRVCGIRFKDVAQLKSMTKILLVDDQASMRRILTFTLSQLAGSVVESCGSGAEALKTVKAHKFDLVVIDRVMPDMDGFEAARQIMASSEFRPAVIMMSSDFSNDDIAACKAIGVDGFLEKPVKLKEFESLWAQVKVNRAKENSLKL